MGKKDDWKQTGLDAGIILILLLALCSASLGVGSNENYYAHQCNGQNQTGQAAEVNNCSGLVVGLGIWADKNHDAIEALSALGGVIFSFVLTASTILLWAETRRLARGADAQSDDMKKSIQEAARAAGAMETSAEAGKRAAVAAEKNIQTVIRSESPILYIEKVEINKQRDGASDVDWIKSIRPIIKIKNYGRSPAIVDEIIVNLMIGRQLPPNVMYQRPREFPASYVIKDELAYREDLIYLTDAFQEDRLVSYGKDAKCRIFIFGKITFRNFLDAKSERGW